MVLVGRSTDTDFSTNVCGALVETGADATGVGIGGPDESGWPMNASTRPARQAAPNPTGPKERFMCPSCRRHVDGLDGVVHEAAWVPVQRRRLDETVAIGAADHNGHGARRGDELRLPLAEAVLALVAAEHRRQPARSAVLAPAFSATPAFRLVTNERGTILLIGTIFTSV